ncbi:MAG TPA: TOPRIM nucleotidyl transferase/hydrolase domain-containing protein [Gaiellaceae bacterium]|nr:TOPRIM nucleotidyl transferase/hydrolase domain-containing protein [Gaiellaceae bacterium]
MGEGPRAVVLVEGISDRIALEALAARRGLDLAGDGVEIVPIGGAQAIGRVLDELVSAGGRRLAGLCDAAEEPDFRRALERTGLGAGLDRAGMERLGFFVCVENLEDELIRGLGAARVEEVLAHEGDLETFRTFQNQPAWRGRPVEAQLRRWLHAADRRNSRYPPLLIEALEEADVLRPLDGVLAAVAA